MGAEARAFLAQISASLGIGRSFFMHRCTGIVEARKVCSVLESFFSSEMLRLRLQELPWCAARSECSCPRQTLTESLRWCSIVWLEPAPPVHYSNYCNFGILKSCECPHGWGNF